LPTRPRWFRALEELLTSLAVSVLAVEDVHWADEATLEFLLFLAFRRPQPVSLVLTYRPDDLPAGSLLPRLTSRPPAGAARLRLTLGLLDVTATASLVSSMLAGEQVSAQFADFIHEHTEGVPLAIEETIRLMAERADLTKRGHGWVHRQMTDIAVPATIRDAVLERTARLDEVTRVVLQAAATLSEPADEAILGAVSGLRPAALQAGLSSALDAGLLRADGRGRISFRHALAAQAAYEAIPAPRQRALHRSAARALEAASPAQVARLTRHYREAGDTDRWCEYAGRTAELALSSGDEATTVGLARELMNAGSAAARQQAGRILDRLSAASLTEPALQDVAGLLRTALDAGPMTSGEEPVSRMRLGRVLTWLDEYELARAELERAVPGLARNPAHAARAMSLLAYPSGPAIPAAVHARWMRRATVLAASLEPGLRLRLRVERAAWLRVLGYEEGWAEAAAMPLEAASADERQFIALGQSNNADLARVWGRYDAAASWLASARELAVAHNYLRYRGNVEITQAHLDWCTGQWGGLADRVRALDGTLSQPMARLEAALVTGLLDAAAGPRSRAEDELRSVLAEALRRGALVAIMEPAGALAWIYLAEGRTADAVEVTGQPAAILVVKRLWVHGTEVVPARIAALAAAGRVDEAAGLAGAFGRGLRRSDAPAAKAALVLCRALLAEARGEHAAARLFARAATAWQALPRPYDALLACERQARCLLSAGRAGEGRELLTEVLAGLSGLGATSSAARTAQALRAAGVRARRPGAGRPGYGGELSPRELEVVRLVTGGQTNQQIAESLYLSPKTVATHVYAAMRKLNVTSRTALAVAAVTSGIAAPGPPGASPRLFIQ
jgi:DNA-binding CsgD family transcriptional regulator